MGPQGRHRPRRVEDLTAYQSARYARRYTTLVNRVREAEARLMPGHTELTEAVARYYYKLLAYKDEYEVARLHTQTGFLERIATKFEGDYKLVFHLAPPLLARPDPVTGEIRKRSFGPWMLRVFALLARLKFLRGTPLDPFAYAEDRKLDRALLADYRKTVDDLLKSLTPENHAIAVELAALPEAVRGYGPVRKRHAEHAAERKAELLEQWNGGGRAPHLGDAGPARVPARVVMAG